MTQVSVRLRYTFILFVAILLLSSIHYLRSDLGSPRPQGSQPSPKLPVLPSERPPPKELPKPPPPPPPVENIIPNVKNDTKAEEASPNVPPPPSDPEPPARIYKTTTDTLYKSTPIIEHFPLAAAAKSSKDLPPIPSWNKPPYFHVSEDTPLFISFTRNWAMLQQVVVGYITAGWPPQDIHVIENTGTMDSNKRKKLDYQNPFYMDHERLTKIYGVNVITLPALFTFSQLQNFYLYKSITRGWKYYYWSHMDVVPQSSEDREPYKSLYMRAVDMIRKTKVKGFARDDQGREGRWALVYLAYDWLTLMNVETMVELGGWDPMISYYGTDCDMYDRMRMANLTTSVGDVGKIYDLGTSLENLEVLYRKKPRSTADFDAAIGFSGPGVRLEGRSLEEDERNSSSWHRLQERLQEMQQDKVHGHLPRNAWQTQQRGGQGDPFYRDIVGFEDSLEITIKAGERVYQAKWGERRCDLLEAGLKLEDAWMIDNRHDCKWECTERPV